MSKVIEFKKPIKLGQKEFVSVVLTEPTVQQILLALPKIEYGTLMIEQTPFSIHLIHLNAGVQVEVVEQMKISDCRAAMKYLQTFPLLLPDDVKKDVEYEDGAMVCLQFPIKDGDREISELVLREPTCKEIADANRTLTEQDFLALTNRALKLLSLVTGRSEDALKRLPISKFREAQKIVDFFCRDGTQDTQDISEL